MNHRTRAIILHTTKYSNTSLIVKSYTEEFGAQTYIISGIRKSKSKVNINLFQPLSLVEIVSVNKRADSMGRITEISWAPAFVNIPFDMVKGTIAMFLSEVLYRSIKEEEKNTTLFNFLHNSIQILDTVHSGANTFHYYFLIQLTKHLGNYPRGNYVEEGCYFDLREGLFLDCIPSHPDYTGKETARIIYTLMRGELSDIPEGLINKSNKEEVLGALVSYYEIHQTHGSRIRSHNVLHEIMQ